MRFAAAAAAAGLAGVASAGAPGYYSSSSEAAPSYYSSSSEAPAPYSSEAPSYVTEVVTAFTTYCPEATYLTHNSQTYTVSEVSYTDATR